MSDIRNGKLYGMIFLFFLVCLVVGGFFLMEYFTSSPAPITKEETREVAIEKNLKLNPSEEYIYYLNNDLKNELYGINYQDIKINIDSSSARTTEIKLNEEMALLRDSFKKLDDVTLTEEEENKISYKETGIYEAKYAKYTRYFYQNYATILKDNYSFDCFNGEKYLTSVAYVFDTKTGELLTNADLLQLYNLNITKIKEKIQERLNTKQSKVTLEKEEDGEKITEEVEVIDIPETLNNLNAENYALYIDKGGFLNVSYLVKSIEKDYNDVIIID